MICFIIFIVNLFLFSLSSYHYSKLKLKCLPDQMPMMIFLVGFISIWISTIKIDLIISEMKNNLSPIKVFYSLIHNSGMTHKLTDSHYRQLAIASRVIEFVCLEVGMPIHQLIAFSLCIIISLITGKTIWICQTIVAIPAIFAAATTLAVWMCIVFVLFSYYKFRFDQINQQIELIILSGKVISKRRQTQLIVL